MENIKISIIMTSYNYSNFIAEAINSVVSQNYQNWELIVVDDGSSDDSVKIITNFCELDERVKIFQHENAQNRGLQVSILLGLENCSGKYIAFLESDDLWAQNYLEEKIKIVETYPSAKVIFNDVELFGDSEVIADYDKYFKMNRKILSSKQYPTNLFSGFSFQNLVPTFSCAMVDAKSLTKADYDTTVEGFLDHWIWAHLAYENDFYYIEKKLTSWRMHEKSYIAKNQQNNEKTFLASILQSLEKNGAKKNMFFWNRHRNSKTEKLLRGFFRQFV